MIPKKEDVMKRVSRLFKCSLLALAIISIALLTGCASYYKVQDTGTGKIYYTTDIDRQDSGSVLFVDESTGSQVNLQNSAVTEVNAEEFRANTKKK